MIKVCDHCSGIDIEGLKKAFPNERILVGCVGICKNIPDVVYGKVNNLLVTVSSDQEFIDEARKIIERKF